MGAAAPIAPTLTRALVHYIIYFFRAMPVMVLKVAFESAAVTAVGPIPALYEGQNVKANLLK